jgi:hypothetical protein
MFAFYLSYKIGSGLHPYTVLQFGANGRGNKKKRSLAQQIVQKPAQMPLNRPVSQELGIEAAGHKLQSLVGSAAPAAAQAAGQEAAPPQQPQTRPRDRTLLMEQLRSVDAIAKQVSFISFLLIAAVIPTTTTRSP